MPDFPPIPPVPPAPIVGFVSQKAHEQWQKDNKVNAIKVGLHQVVSAGQEIKQEWVDEYNSLIK